MTSESFYACTIARESGCIEWDRAIDSNGYGAVRYFGKKMNTHRVAVLLAGVEIPKGMDVCHRCNNRKCVNVDHLYVGTRSQNMQDAKRAGKCNPKNQQRITDVSDEQIQDAVRMCGSPTKAANFLRVPIRGLIKRLRALQENN